MARAGGHDPLELRQRLLQDAPRHRAVLDLAAEKAGWGQPLPSGRHRGVAIVDDKGSLCAQVAEVSLVGAQGFRVHRLVCATDCGQILHPDAAVAQIEGAALLGLSEALFEEITLRDGRVEQSNFHDYRILRMSETPSVEVHLLEGINEPLGVGEVGVPPVAAAVANALYTATGRPVRSLPIRLSTG